MRRRDIGYGCGKELLMRTKTIEADKIQGCGQELLIWTRTIDADRNF